MLTIPFQFVEWTSCTASVGETLTPREIYKGQEKYLKLILSFSVLKLDPLVYWKRFLCLETANLSALFVNINKNFALFWIFNENAQYFVLQ